VDPGLGLIHGIPYTSNGWETLEVIRPTEGGPYPIVVAFPGTFLATTTLHPLAELSARQGAVWFIANYDHGPWDPGNETAGIEDVAATVRFARANAAKYGGDPGRIIVVGHSSGAGMGFTVAMAGDEFTVHRDYAGTSALADGYVGLDPATRPITEHLSEEERVSYALNPTELDRADLNHTWARCRSEKGSSSASSCRTSVLAMRGPAWRRSWGS
jgi:dienelactone hydrolase